MCTVTAEHFMDIGILQVQYNPRRLTNAGLADGECMERLWTYLRKFADVTKSMSSDRRTDVLSSALLHYATKTRESMGKYTDE